MDCLAHLVAPARGGGRARVRDLARVDASDAALNDSDLEPVSGGNNVSSSYYAGTVATGGLYTKPTARKVAESDRETEGR